MTWQRAVLTSLAVAAVLVQVAVAVNHDVGGGGGWQPSDMDSWASSRTFLVGDNLVFKYSPMHNVVEVGKSDYDSCQVTNVIQASSDGNTVVALKTPGKRYFICGMPGHCVNGMKLEVNALAATSPATPPATSPATSPPPPRHVVSPSIESPAAAAPAEAPTPAAAYSPDNDDVIPSVLPNFAPSGTVTARDTSPAVSSAPAGGIFRDGLALGLFGAVVMVFAV